MSRIERRTFLGAAAGSGLLVAGAAGARAAEEKPEVDTSSLGKTPHTKFACNLEMWWRKLPFLERVQGGRVVRSEEWRVKSGER
jgi:hypothetical protein